MYRNRVVLLLYRRRRHHTMPNKATGRRFWRHFFDRDHTVVRDQRYHRRMYKSLRYSVPCFTFATQNVSSLIKNHFTTLPITVVNPCPQHVWKIYRFPTSWTPTPVQPPCGEPLEPQKQKKNSRRPKHKTLCDNFDCLDTHSTRINFIRSRVQEFTVDKIFKSLCIVTKSCVCMCVSVNLSISNSTCPSNRVVCEVRYY